MEHDHRVRRGKAECANQLKRRDLLPAVVRGMAVAELISIHKLEVY